MSHRALRLLLAPILLLVCSLVLPPDVRAQEADEAFKQGLEARGDRKWAEAAKFMREAIQRDSRESMRRVRTGVIGGLFSGGTEYMPHYFLGDVLFEAQDCAGAVEAWVVSMRQGVVQGKDDFAARIASGNKACAARGILLANEFDPLQQSTNQVYTEAAGMAERVFKARNSNRELWQQGDFEARYARGQREIETAYARLNEATRSRLAADFKAARDAVDRGLAILRPLELGFSATIANVLSVEQRSRQVEQAIEAADSIDQAIEGIKAGLTPTLQGSRKEGQSRLVQARERLVEGRKRQSQSDVEEAAKQVSSATAILTDVLEQGRKGARSVLEQRLSRATMAATQAFAFVDTSSATLDRLTIEKAAAVKPELAGEREAIEKEIDALRRRLDRATKAEDVANIETTARLTSDLVGRLDALIKSFGPVTLRDRGVVQGLEDGARLFFNGDYQQALDALGPASTLADAPLQVHIHLFRAAALYALFVRSGETNLQLRAEALAAVERCRQLDPTFAPDPDVFSPRFITLYEGASVPQASAAAPASPQ